jgi:hypothetical protein
LNNAKGAVTGRNISEDVIRRLLRQTVLHRNLGAVRVDLCRKGIFQSLESEIADALILETLSDPDTD